MLSTVTVYRTQLSDLFVGQLVVERGDPGVYGLVETIGPLMVIVQMVARNRYDDQRRRAFWPRDLTVMS
jgi:hypothetical protein